MLSTEQERKIIRLRFVDGWSIGQISDRLLIGKATVHRAATAFINDLLVMNVDPDLMPPDGLRDIVLVLLKRAAAVYADPAAPVETIDSHWQLLAAI